MSWSRIDGQELAVRMLSAHLRRQRVPPAYVFAGPDGVGKRLAAIEYAKALTCESPEALRQGACDRCRPCGQIDRGVWPDLHVLGPGSSGAIKLEEVREAFERVALRPFIGRVQIAVILDADRLTDEAANSLLKTLEEPPSAARFVLTTTEPAHCLPTIVSRCQLVRFRPLPVAVIERLAREAGVDAIVAAHVARLAHGSAARAQVLAEQWAAYRTRRERLAAGEAATWMAWAQPEQRQELADWLAHGVWWLRDVSVAGVSGELPLQHQDDSEAVRRQAGRLDRRRCVETAMRLVELWDSLEQAANPRLVASAFREQWLRLLSVPG